MLKASTSFVGVQCLPPVNCRRRANPNFMKTNQKQKQKLKATRKHHTGIGNHVTKQKQVHAVDWHSDEELSTSQTCSFEEQFGTGGWLSVGCLISCVMVAILCLSKFYHVSVDNLCRSMCPIIAFKHWSFVTVHWCSTAACKPWLIHYHSVPSSNWSTICACIKYLFSGARPILPSRA